MLPPRCTTNKKSRSAALEFQDFPGFSTVFQDPCLFPGLSRPGILNNKISGLSRVCTNPDDWSCKTLLTTLDASQNEWHLH